jgi:hypothetical protein
MDHFVDLDRLPEGFLVPPDLAEQVHLDPDLKRLSFRGFMSKADYDRLSLLSEDWSYRRHLEDLFRQCSLVQERPRRLAPGWIVGAVVSLLAVVAFWFWLHPTGPPRDTPTAHQASIPHASP